MDGCTFCDIAAGRVPAHVVYEDDACMAFLDIRPLFPGHVLVIPRVHHETIDDLPSDLLEPVMATTQRLSRGVRGALDAQGTFVAMNNRVSQSVPHLHVHVVPRNRKDGLRGFFWPRVGYDDEEHMVRTADAITAALERAS